MLLAAPIKDEEIFELLERLAATEEMFKAPVSTIRDVAELTEASPNLIARILGEIRGPGEFEKLVKRVDSHDDRFEKLQAKLDQVSMPVPIIIERHIVQTEGPKVEHIGTDKWARKTRNGRPILKINQSAVLFIFVIILILFISANSDSHHIGCGRL